MSKPVPPRWHLHDVVHREAISLCGRFNPPLMTVKIAEVTCCRCLDLHERRMERAPQYRAAREEIAKKP